MGKVMDALNDELADAIQAIRNGVEEAAQSAWVFGLKKATISLNSGITTAFRAIFHQLQNVAPTAGLHSIRAVTVGNCQIVVFRRFPPQDCFHTFGGYADTFGVTALTDANETYASIADAR
jgi:hypothetical protein